MKGWDHRLAVCTVLCTETVWALHRLALFTQATVALAAEANERAQALHDSPGPSSRSKQRAIAP